MNRQPPDCPNPLSETLLDAWLGGYGDAVTDSNGTWAVINRSALAGAGEWTHYYANPANTAKSSIAKKFTAAFENKRSLSSMLSHRTTVLPQTIFKIFFLSKLDIFNPPFVWNNPD